jgi:hypothetical protein
MNMGQRQVELVNPHLHYVFPTPKTIHHIRPALRGRPEPRPTGVVDYFGAEGDDPVPWVPGAWLADRQRPYGIAMQTMHETAQRLRSPLGPAQRHVRRGPRYAG